jgi:Ca2+-binding RTX toxin-like protein
VADFTGTESADFIFGTSEADRLIGLGGNDFLFGTGGDDLIEGGDGDDALNGGTGDDVIEGGAGDDSILGDEGFFGVIGADTLTGGGGNDQFAWFVGTSDSTSLVQDVVTDFEGAGVAGGDTLLLRLPFDHNRRLVFEGQLDAMPAVGGALAGGGNGFTEVFFAFDGGDTVVFADSDDDGVFDADDFAVRLTGEHALVRSDFGATAFVTVGTEGADRINGTEDADTIFALGGNDTVSGGNGDDVIDGGRGGDTLSGDAGNDRISGGDGNDTISGGEGIDRLTGGAGNDVIDGGAGRDTVLAGGDGNDLVFGRAGNDTLDGDAGNDMLFGGTDNDTLFGLEGNDALFGEDGNDDLFGGEGNDVLSGGAGVDEIEGEEGADILAGGAGADQFDFFTSPFQPDSIWGTRDLVLDFEGAGAEGGDVIRLSGDSYAFAGELAIEPKAGASLGGAGDGVTQLGYAHRKGNTFLIADSDDDGVLDNDDFAVEFTGIHDFTVEDFDNTDFVIAGTNGDDVITGTEGDDRIFAAGGNDQAFGLGGNDEIHGGIGDDLLDGGPGGFDDLQGEDGNDTLTLATSDFGGNASGGNGNDVLFGSDTSFGSFDHSLRGDAGDDDLHAGAVGSSMDGGAGADRLFNSAADDQMSGGRDDFTFELDGARDLFVYGSEGWGFDTVFGYEDGVDQFDMRGSGLTFGDLTITNEDFQTTIESSRGVITLFENFNEPVDIAEDDFLFA